MKQSALIPHFVDYIPERLSEGAIYISERYRTAVHLCCCGCGEEVVTPITPADWQVRKESNDVTLYPSIGNWGFACQSHYWIKKNRVEWAPAMTKQQIARVRRKDRLDKARYIAQVNSVKQESSANRASQEPDRRAARGVWQSLRRWLGIQGLTKLVMCL